MESRKAGVPFYPKIDTEFDSFDLNSFSIEIKRVDSSDTFVSSVTNFTEVLRNVTPNVSEIQHGVYPAGTQVLPYTGSTIFVGDVIQVNVEKVKVIDKSHTGITLKTPLKFDYTGGSVFTVGNTGLYTCTLQIDTPGIYEVYIFHPRFGTGVLSYEILPNENQLLQAIQALQNHKHFKAVI
jgi:hypothetical protein